MQGEDIINETFILSSDSPADLTAEFYARRNINYVPYPYMLGGERKVDDLFTTMTSKEFFDAMAAGADTSTSQPNAEDFVEHFTPFLEQGKDILHLCLSSGLSGVMNSATLALETLNAKYPDRKIYIVDTLGASRGFGLLVDKAADLRDEGRSIDEVRDWLEEHKLNLHHWFFSTDLTYYVRGGRITKAAGWFGTMLNICPLLNMDAAGHLVPRKKCRGKAAVKREIVKMMAENVLDGFDYSEKVFLSFADCLQDAQDVASEVEKTFPKMNGKVQVESIGPIIGSHTGPGTVALFFFGKKRAD